MWLTYQIVTTHLNNCISNYPDITSFRFVLFIDIVIIRFWVCVLRDALLEIAIRSISASCETMKAELM